jgi:hypothetical protein
MKAALKTKETQIDIGGLGRESGESATDAD